MPKPVLLTAEEQQERLDQMVRIAEQQGWIRSGGIVENGATGIQQDMYKIGRLGKVTGVLNLIAGQTGHTHETVRYTSWWFFEEKGYQLFLATLATAATICAAAAAIATCVRPIT
ncbi:MAG: hypothetical protein OXG43_04710 [Chloroflexi bacterium]|nr:hypothetical protein [Chloroflexota bacterium]